MDTATTPSSWREAGDTFLRAKRNLGRGDATLEQYGEIVRQFVAWMGDRPFGEVGVATVQEFLEYRRARSRCGDKTSGSTRNRWARSIGVFLRWLWRVEALQSRLRPLEKCTEKKRVRRVPTPETLPQITDAVRKYAVILPPEERENLADIKVVIDNTGFRFREAHYLRVSDCNFISGELLLSDWEERPLKDHEERMVKMTEPCREVLMRRCMAQSWKPDARLFQDFSLSHRRVLDAFKQASTAIGAGAYTLHALRGSFTTYNTAKFNEVELMLQMGWATITTARKWYHRGKQARLPVPNSIPPRPVDPPQSNAQTEA